MRRSPRLAARRAPAPFRCDDFIHCRANNTNQGCDPNDLHTCPGLPNWTPRSYNGLLHPNPDTVRVCGRCLLHDHAIRLRDIVKNQDRVHVPCHGCRGQLCETCILDEVSLFWRRSGTTRPAGPASLPMVAQWPSVAGGVQNLCICEQKGIVPFENHCHNCRDRAFERIVLNDRAFASDIRRHRKISVIRGEQRCVSNGGTEQHRNSAAVVAERELAPHRIVRMCPCGNRPKPPLPRTQEYCTICTSCMGVRIVPWNLPNGGGNNAGSSGGNRRRKKGALDDLSRAHFGTRHSPRAAGVTKGPRRAARSHLFRVNIERGWVDNDPFVGGTY